MFKLWKKFKNHMLFEHIKEWAETGPQIHYTRHDHDLFIENCKNMGFEPTFIDTVFQRQLRRFRKNCKGRNLSALEQYDPKQQLKDNIEMSCRPYLEAFCDAVNENHNFIRPIRFVPHLKIRHFSLYANKKDIVHSVDFETHLVVDYADRIHRNPAIPKVLHLN